jgi:hypothetical protein
MFSPSKRILLGFTVSLLGSTLCLVLMVLGVGSQAFVGAGLLAFLAPATAVIAWKMLRPVALQAPSASLGPVAATQQWLQLALWIGLAAAGAIWTLAASQFDFQKEALFWVCGPLACVVGLGVGAMVVRDMRRPFPPIVVDDGGLRVGQAPVVPWAQISGVAWRRSLWAYGHIEVQLTSGHSLRPQLPVAISLEDMEAFFQVVGRHLPAAPARAAPIPA